MARLFGIPIGWEICPPRGSHYWLWCPYSPVSCLPSLRASPQLGAMTYWAARSGDGEMGVCRDKGTRHGRASPYHWPTSSQLDGWRGGVTSLTTVPNPPPMFVCDSGSSWWLPDLGIPGVALRQPLQVWHHQG